MKVGCVDKSAADRLSLQARIEQSYEQCRASLGLLRVGECIPLTKEETLTTSSTPFSATYLREIDLDVVAIGPNLPFEELFSYCRDLRSKYPQLPVMLFISDENYSVDLLRRLERFEVEIFAVNDPSARVVHYLVSLSEVPKSVGRGKLVVVSGVKGGVGVSSIVSGLGHAAQALGQSVVIVDLSVNHSLGVFLGLDRLRSSDLATALVENLPITDELLEMCVVSAANGLDLLLPPAGGSETRELWLRSVERFELSLEVFERLQDRYSVVLVDTAGVDGLLPYALNVRADTRLLVAANDPASVCLLYKSFDEISAYPGAGETAILVNMLAERSLTFADVCEACKIRSPKHSDSILAQAVRFDSAARFWMGTGNSFYTEGGRQLQLQLQQIVTRLINNAADSISIETICSNTDWLTKLRKQASRIKTIAAATFDRGLAIAPPRLALPESVAASDTDSGGRLDPLLPREILVPEPSLSEADLLEGYVPPQLAVNQRGSTSLELLVAISGIVLTAAISLPIFLRQFGGYLRGFSE